MGLATDILAKEQGRDAWGGAGSYIDDYAIAEAGLPESWDIKKHDRIILG